MKSIESRVVDHVRRFRLEFDIDGKPAVMEVGANELLSYITVKAMALNQFAAFFCIPEAEGRTLEMADYFWGLTVDSYLRRAQQAADSTTLN